MGKVVFLFLMLGMTATAQNTQRMEKRMLALGDSYTIGESVFENERWPVQLVKMLNEAGNNFKTPEIIAKTGWTTDELIAAIKVSNPQGTFDLVSLLIGVNNQYRGNNIEDYKIEFERLLKMAIHFAGNNSQKVVVVSIPDWGVTPFAHDKDKQKIKSEIDYFNKVNFEVALAYEVKYVEITAASRLAENDHELIAADGLHPSAKMYKQWAKNVFEKIQ
jgi:lysophospholipase L1-like esterase